MAYGQQTQRVMQAVRSKISSRALEPGEKLPSIRGFASTMKVSASTVVEAYDRLAAEGVIFARKGAGFYVSPKTQPFSVSEIGPHLDREIDPFWVSRQSLDTGRDMLKPGCGWMPADWMPNASLRKAIRNLSKADDHLLSDYASTRGASNLRRLQARQFAAEGIEVDPNQILLTGSATQSIDLLCRFLLRPGDKVLVSDPCYFNFQAILKAHQVEIVSVPYTKTGMDCEQFEQAVVEHKPRFYISNTSLHNPTGVTLSPQGAHKILSIATRHDLILIEDDVFSEFLPEITPRLTALGGFDRVIRLGSFSKTLSASARCGYIAAKPEWIEALVDLQVATNFGGPSPITTELIYACLSDGSYRKHMEALRIRLAKTRREVSANLAELGIQTWLMPEGGFYLWCSLPEGIDSAELARAALQQNMVLAPGDVFSPTQSMGQFMRFNVSQMGNPMTYEILADVMCNL
ncbi:DNA-binding transcriptional regulator, MocR family, contains an aminotransferase domain [Pseudovibrio ascidiaceicola]|uniref:DNA-binding transcriptional regulator, MocR family, contains an aminotransferase domain n=1 Tax=Pseudovibrio ascidiaceicola TaxID=285279 RepID=A0A1I3YIV4_9HYPH|nr:PLP-dependent aminotransferase family protein [Pseudovibrio ascidiaceicola]SFK31201.1 DNA-binding transcriptional regulator, MocR family, contains an aminotransferase domain [Pseudovibrio ascidiaceicola]